MSTPELHPLPTHLLDGKYEVTSYLGRGGFGTVFLANDIVVSNRQVAIKMLNDTDQERQDSLLKEMRLLSELNHPSVVTFLHHFLDNGKLHLVMEYCEGGSLRGLLRQKQRPDLTTLVGMFVEAASALEVVHEKSIVHHDIKPDNILFSSSGKLKIGDFGVANEETGTSYYLPPEFYSQGHVTADDPRCDVYALGVTFVECLTGEHPFIGLVGKNLLLRKIQHDWIPSKQPRWIQDIILRATHPTPELRFQTMKELREAMESKHVPFLLNQTKMRAHELAVKAEVLIRRKKWRDALGYIDGALSANPESTKAVVVAGRYKLALNRVPEARGHFERALRLNPRVEVQKELGWIYLEEGKYSMAISMLTDYLDRNAGDYEAINLLARCFYETQRYEQAVELCKPVIQKNASFSNNQFIARVLSGEAIAVHDIDKLRDDKNPFLEYNAKVLLEEPKSWSLEGKPTLKSKLLFQEYRFGVRPAVRKENSVSVFKGSRQREFGEPLVSFGSLASNTIPLKDSSVSRRHCVVVNFPRDVWLYDLASTIGTSIDGRRVHGKQFLLGVHSLLIGKVELRIASSSDLLL